MLVMYQVSVGYVPGPRWLCTRLVLVMYHVSVGYVSGECWICTKYMLFLYQFSVIYLQEHVFNVPGTSWLM